jgi:hypothetical protein
MNVGELMKKLEKLPQDLDIRMVDIDNEDETNLWVVDIEVSNKGESGYELNGEVRLIVSE